MRSFLHIKNKYYTQLLPLGIIFFLGVATLLTFIISQKRQEIRSKALTQNAILSFSPPTISVSPNGTFNVSVILDTTAQAALGADILVHFDNNKLLLTTITKGTNGTFKTFAPITDQTTGNFDVSRVISCANTGAFNSDSTKCPSGAAVVEFGIVAFDWAAASTSPLPSPFAGIMSPVATLTFQVKSGISNTSDILEFVHIDNPKFQNGVWSGTKDSNVVANPSGTGDPEDILAVPTSTVTVTIASTGGSPSPTPTPSVSPTSTPSPSNNPSPTPSPTTSPSSSPTASPSSGTTPQLTLEFSLEGLVGVLTARPTKQFTLIFKKAGTQDETVTPNFDFSPATYLYHNSTPISLAASGTYSISVTAPSYLPHTFTGISIINGSQSISLTNFMLLAGDAINIGVSANVINLYDYNNIFNNFNCKSAAGATPPPNKACNSFKSDFDFDGDVDIHDYNYMMGNYGKTGN